MIILYAIVSLVNGRIYVGQTQNLEKRLKELNSGSTKSTKGYIPWRLFFQETCENREQARIREKYWKSGIGKEKLRLFLHKNNRPHSSMDTCLPPFGMCARQAENGSFLN